MENYTRCTLDTCFACRSGHHEDPALPGLPCDCPCHGSQPQAARPPLPDHAWTPGCTCAACQAYKLTCSKREHQHIHAHDFPETGSSGQPSSLDSPLLAYIRQEDTKATAFVKECGYQVKDLIGQDKVTAVDLLISLAKVLRRAYVEANSRATRMAAKESEVIVLQHHKTERLGLTNCQQMLYWSACILGEVHKTYWGRTPEEALGWLVRYGEGSISGIRKKYKIEVVDPL